MLSTAHKPYNPPKQTGAKRGDRPKKGTRHQSAVGRHQPDVTVAASQRLDGRLVVKHCGNDVAVVGVGLLTDDDPVAVGDRGVDHRLADHLEHEQRSLADERLRQWEDVLDALLGEDRPTGGDTAHDRNEDRCIATWRFVGDGQRVGSMP